MKLGKAADPEHLLLLLMREDFFVLLFRKRIQLEDSVSRRLVSNEEQKTTDSRGRLRKASP